RFWRGVIRAFHLPPCSAPPSLIVVESNPEHSAGSNEIRYQVHCSPHLPGVMEHPPRIHDVEATQPMEVLAIECAASLDPPTRVLREVTPAQFGGARNRGGIEVETDDLRA